MNETSMCIDNQAAEWFVKNSSDPALVKSEAFRHWLSEDPAHAKAYEQMEAVWGDLDALKRCTDEAKATRTKRSKYVNRWIKMAASVAAIALITVTLVYLTDMFKEQPLYTQTFDNPIGELSRFELPDTSEITIDADTNLSVAFYKDRREIHLDKGQIIVHAAKNPLKPLYVYAGEIRVKVVGTIFEVRKWGDESRVTVEEGKVEIHRYSATSGEYELLGSLLPNQQLSYNQQNDRFERDELLADRIALWRDGSVTFEKTTLADVVEEFGRYEKHRIQIEDEKVKRLIITGIFDLRSSKSFLETLPLALPVEVVHKNGQDIIRLR